MRDRASFLVRAPALCGDQALAPRVGDLAVRAVQDVAEHAPVSVRRRYADRGDLARLGRDLVHRRQQTLQRPGQRAGCEHAYAVGAGRQERAYRQGVRRYGKRDRDITHLPAYGLASHVDRWTRGVPGDRPFGHSPTSRSAVSTDAVTVGLLGLDRLGALRVDPRGAGPRARTSSTYGSSASARTGHWPNRSPARRGSG